MGSRRTDASTRMALFPRNMNWSLARLPATALLLVLTACGGGGDSDSGLGTGGGGGGGGGGIAPPTGFGGNGSWTQGVYQPSSVYAARCVAPRSGVDPQTGQAYRDVTGTVTDENNWLRSWTNELYLWYSEVPDLNPASYTTPAYFDLLKTSAKTSTNADKDRFHFTYPTPEWLALSGSGESVAYGVQWALIPGAQTTRVIVAYVEPTVPPATATAALSRGVEVTTVDSVSLTNVQSQAQVDIINAALFPDTAGESHTFTVKELNGTTRNISLQAAVVTSAPVPVVKTLTPLSGGKVGYILFNDHIATAEGALFNAIETLKAAAIDDLVLDIRYNGGGYLDIASQLAYMIAGPTATAGRTFERLQFNNKHPTTNPVTGEAITPTPFHSTSAGFSNSFPANVALPTLNLPRVYVLTGSGTCSASEAIINGLRGVDVQVIQIGSTTCGKPYGFYPEDNCGTTYFSIQFRGVNEKSFGDYTDGFVPSATGNAQAQVQGCSIADDFTGALGDPTENRLEAALGYRATGACFALATEPGSLEAVEGVVPKPLWRMNRILRD